MSILLVILSLLMWIGAFILLFRHQMLAPLASWAGLCCVWLSETLPLNSTIIVSWMGMTLITMIATWLQPEPLRQQTRGVGYMLGGGVPGMIIGRLGNSIAASLSLLYGIMVAATAVGVVIGGFLFTNTPDGQKVNIKSGHFLTYLSAKGFPIGITVMQMGIVLVLLLAMKDNYWI